jgi:hypothetical protein
MINSWGDPRGDSQEDSASDGFKGRERRVDFWPAVWAHLPGLKQLTIRDRVYGAVGAHELASFSSHATRPLQMELGGDLYKRVWADGELARQCQVWGVPHVAVCGLGV